MIFIISLSRKHFFHYMHFAFHFHLTFFSQDAFSSPLLSIMQTFSMMLGDINYHDAFLEPYLRNELAYPLLSFAHLIVFTMFVPIVLMNLLVSNLSLYFLLADHLGRLIMIMIYSLFSLPSWRGRGDYYKIHSFNIHLVPGACPVVWGQRMQRCIHLASIYREPTKCQTLIQVQQWWTKQTNAQSWHDYKLVMKLSSKPINM